MIFFLVKLALEDGLHARNMDQKMVCFAIEIHVKGRPRPGE